MRRRIALLALVATSAILAACAQVTAPKDDCRSGYVNSEGFFVCTDPG